MGGAEFYLHKGDKNPSNRIDKEILILVVQPATNQNRFGFYDFQMEM